MFHREVKDFSVYSWLFVTPGFYPVSTDDLLEANVRFCLVSNLQKVSSFPIGMDRSDHFTRAAKTTFSFEFWDCEFDGGT